MPRSIEEIQRDLEQTDQNLNSIARQTQRIDRGLHVLDEQEKNVAGRALAPTQIGEQANAYGDTWQCRRDREQRSSH